MQDRGQEIQELLRTLPNDFTEAWKKVLEWLDLKQSALASSAGRSEQTISTFINNPHKGSLETLGADVHCRRSTLGNQ